MKKVYQPLFLSLIMILILTGMSPLPGPLQPGTVITVDTFIDSNHMDYQACTAAPDDCSLRGAISKSNAASGGIGTIVIPEGIYELSIVGADNNNALGDLDIYMPVTLQGAGMGVTVIQAGPSKGNGIDRVIEIRVWDLSPQPTDVNIYDLTFRWGTISSGSDGGAGIYSPSLYNDILIERVSIEENEINITAPGGGLFVNGEMVIRDSYISNNKTASHEGGGIYNTVGSNLMIERSTINGNEAGSYGGGMANQDVAILRNVTISGNSAKAGGGGITQWNFGDLTTYNTTITNNSVTDSDSGWAIENPRTFTAYNSIFTAAAGKEACKYGGFPGANNIATDGSCGASATVSDPLLGLLSDNGGYTYTHALPEGSPAIDAGDNTSCEDIDQRGNIRPIDGDHNGIATCDIGAYEYGTRFDFYLPLIIR